MSYFCYNNVRRTNTIQKSYLPKFAKQACFVGSDTLIQCLPEFETQVSNPDAGVL
jgi:hypothetical protein